ncbi:MAG: hypothetical protein EA397_13755 [Deltaproteobacteria bacterium]|nr:MAG: hypothetical protein EA397_13755 [Deltaproteobacteria bacterium]
MRNELGALDRLAAIAETLATPLLPAWGVVHFLHPRLRADMGERWGLSSAPCLPGSIWIVASSVGEVAAAEALLPHLQGPVLLSADTDTGAQAARRAVRPYPLAVATARPVDHPWTLAPLWAEARPRAVVFVEGAWWPSLAALAHRAEVPVLGVQARPGRRAFSGWRRGLRAIAARGEREAEALRRAGLPVVVLGDLKADRPLPPPPLGGLQGAIVGVSTRSLDEELALVRAAQAVAPSRRVVIAPRHPDRFEACFEALHQAGVSVQRRSTLRGPATAPVLLLDSLGELAGVLSVAKVAFIGGTFDAKIGGHSPAEALRGGAVVLAGPHTWSHPEAFQAALPADRTSLPEALERALEAPSAPRPLSGAGARITQALEPWLQGPPAPEHAPRPWARPLAPLFRPRAPRGLPQRLDAAILAVGSANVRGSYKTAAAAWAARHLKAQGHRVGIAVRGHGRTLLGGPRRGVFLSEHRQEARWLGDEGARLALAGFRVAASPDRRRACRALIASGCTAVVVEDGLRLRTLAFDEILAVIDQRCPGGRGPFPAGERRGPAVPPHATALLAVGEGPVPRSGLPCAVLSAHAGPWHRGEALSDPPPVAVAILGVGSPGAALVALREGPLIHKVVRRPDHAPIEAQVRDLLRTSAAIVTSAKDAARLPPELRAQVYWREVELRGAWPLGPIRSPFDPKERP